jgi:proteasome lid subunit RPN8/RPN11
MRAEISRALLDRLLAEAAATPECEVCGLLFGRALVWKACDARGLVIDDVWPAANVSANPADSFEIDPATVFEVIRAERAGGPRLIGHYHSHPRGVARPSPRDAEAALDAGRLWLIVGDGEATAWCAVPGGTIEGAFEPVGLHVV